MLTLKGQPEQRVSRSQETADDPNGQQGRKTHPEPKSACKFHVTGSHEADGVDEKKAAKANGCAEQARGPIALERIVPKGKCSQRQDGAGKHEPIWNATLSKVIDGDE